MSMAELAVQVRNMGFLGHPVVDLTGLKGKFDFSFTLTLPGQRAAHGPADPDRPRDISVFDALDKDLGLKLEAVKHPVTMLVIDKSVVAAADAMDATPLTKKAAQFEVAEIHATKPGTTPGRRVLPSGQAEMANQSLAAILQTALNVEADRIVGLPKWAETDHYDIAAKAPLNQLNFDTLPIMLLGLIRERFKLETHEADSPITVYGITVSKKGLKLKASAGTARSSCKASAAEGKKVLTCENTTMAEFADKLRAQAPAYIDHAVVDLTGLKDAYDFSFAWTVKSHGAPQAGVTEGVASDPNGSITIFEVLEKELGLKLELTKHPMPAVVIDRLERTPTEN